MTSSTHPLADPGSFAPVNDGLASSDPLRWPRYTELQSSARSKSGAGESVVAGPASIGGVSVELALFDFSYLGGSMGEVAGERLARSMERAAGSRVPFVLRTSTGGARMQEGMLALVQMPKTVIARALLAEAHVPFVAVLAHPTTGGVFASLGSLADVTVAETDATVGFAGPRVAERLSGRPLAGASHTATAAFRHGLVDEVVPPSEMHTFLAATLQLLTTEQRQQDPPPTPAHPGSEPPDPWTLVTQVRDRARPTGEQIVRGIGDPVLTLRGDRAGSDDPALTTALTRIRGRRAIVLALDRDHAPGPGAYRKARRCIAIAERLRLPLVSLIDTRGADPSSTSENAGIAGEIATTFDTLLHCRVPTVAVVTGEGGSGGALAFACTDRLLALETSIFSVIGPEGAAEILWRDASRAPEAARLLRLTAPDLLRSGIVDAVVPDDYGAGLAAVLAYHLDELTSHDLAEVREARFQRWRRRI